MSAESRNVFYDRWVKAYVATVHESFAILVIFRMCTSQKQRKTLGELDNPGLLADASGIARLQITLCEYSFQTEPIEA